jgi:hypothetical protein
MKFNRVTPAPSNSSSWHACTFFQNRRQVSPDLLCYVQVLTCYCSFVSVQFNAATVPSFFVGALFHQAVRLNQVRRRFWKSCNIAITRARNPNAVWRTAVKFWMENSVPDWKLEEVEFDGRAFLWWKSAKGHASRETNPDPKFAWRLVPHGDLLF